MADDEGTGAAGEPEAPAAGEPETPADVAIDAGDKVYAKVKWFAYAVMVPLVLLYVIGGARNPWYLIGAWSDLLLAICVSQVWELIFDGVAWATIGLMIVMHAGVMWWVYPFLLKGVVAVGLVGAAIDFGLMIALMTWTSLRFNRWKASQA